MEFSLGMLEGKEPRRYMWHRVVLIRDVGERRELCASSVRVLQCSNTVAYHRIDHVGKLLIAYSRQTEHNRVDFDTGIKLHTQHHSIECRNRCS